MALNDVKKIYGRVIYLEGNVPAQAAYIESVTAVRPSPGTTARRRMSSWYSASRKGYRASAVILVMELQALH